MSVFDVDSFMTEEVTEALSTSLTPLDEGEYAAVVESVEVKTPGDYVILEALWQIDEDDAEAACGRRNVKIKQAIFLDIVDGRMDTSNGKNVGLGRLREALGQNDGSPWSPAMLEGQPALVKVVQDPDKNDSEVIYNRVVAVTSA